MAKKCWKLEATSCQGVPLSGFTCAEDMIYVAGGGLCGGGYYQSTDAGYGSGNASMLQGTVQQVTLANCGAGCLGEEPGGGSEVGSSAANPILIPGLLITATGEQTDFAAVTGIVGEGEGTGNGDYAVYTPPGLGLSGKELNLAADVYAGQSLQFVEFFTMNFIAVDVARSPSIYLNRAFPYALVGFWQLKEQEDTANLFFDQGQINATISSSGNTASCRFRHIHAASIRPKKDDRNSSVRTEMDVCNLRFYPNGPATITGFAAVLPNYYAQGIKRSFKGLSAYEMTDSYQIYVKWHFSEVGIYVVPGWKLNNVTHTISPYNSTVGEVGEYQLDLNTGCQDGADT